MSSSIIRYHYPIPSFWCGKVGLSLGMFLQLEKLNGWKGNESRCADELMEQNIPFAFSPPGLCCGAVNHTCSRKKPVEKRGT